MGIVQTEQDRAVRAVTLEIVPEIRTLLAELRSEKSDSSQADQFQAVNDLFARYEDVYPPDLFTYADIIEDVLKIDHVEIIENNRLCEFPGSIDSIIVMRWIIGLCRSQRINWVSVLMSGKSRIITDRHVEDLKPVMLKAGNLRKLGSRDETQ